MASAGDHPSLKELVEIVKPVIWFEVGLSLLGHDEHAKLYSIKVDNKNDSEKCCLDMFQYWLQTDVNASWGKLVAALKQIEQDDLAMVVEEKHVAKRMHGKNLPPSSKEVEERKNIKKYDHVILIIHVTTRQHDGMRPLIQVLKKINYIEMVFAIDASQFEDTQTLRDEVVEEFKQKIAQKITKDATVFVYIQGPTSCVYTTMDVSRDKKMMFMGAVVINRVDSDEMVYLLAHDIQRLLVELQTNLLTIFLDGHYDHSSKCELILSKKGNRKVTKNFTENLNRIWTPMVPLHSRAVLLTTFPNFHITNNCPCFSLHDMVTSVIERWIIAGSLTQGSHRDFYESVSYLLYQERRISNNYIFIQGDKERQFCGKDYIPYDHWIVGNLSFSELEQVQGALDKEIMVVVGSLLEFKKDEEVDIFHLLQPMSKAKGIVTKVTDQYCLVKLADDGFSPLRSLMEDICKSKMMLPFVSIKKLPKSLVKQKSPVDVCIDDKLLSEELTANINKIALLRVATERDTESIVIRQEVDRSNVTYYVVVDQAKDVAQAKVAVDNPNQLLVFLKQIAWFKYIKKLKRVKILLTALDYTCSATSETKLLDSCSIPHKVEIKASSILSPETSADFCILQFVSGPSRYWKPARDDRSCHLEINLKSNHNITAIELRGDAQYEQYVKAFDLLCKTLENQEVEISPGDKVQIESSSGTIKRIVAKEVTITFQNYGQFTECKFRFMQLDKAPIEMIPVMVEGADGTYGQDADGWITIPPSEESQIMITLFLKDKSLLKLLQFDGKPRAQSGDCKAVFSLKYMSDWRREPMQGCSSVWPVKRELSSPMKAAVVRIVPTMINEYPALQLQLHGNPAREGKAVEVFDNEQVTFYFCNDMEDKGLFFNVLCLEETGAIQMLLCEYVEPMQCKKRIMEVFIQKFHDTISTVDIYKIYVSHRKPVLDVLLQDSILEYEAPTSYNVYSFGSPLDDMKNDEPWNITDIPIHIKKYQS